MVSFSFLGVPLRSHMRSQRVEDGSPELFLGNLGTGTLLH